MPAPLGNTPTKKMPRIEVFGLEDSQATRAAVRFFRERRIVVRFVDLGKQPLDSAQLRLFIDRLGAAALMDGEPGADRGSLTARIRADATLLRLPLVRHGDEMTAGRDETTWAAWLARRNAGRGPKSA
jgi:arsenate reductase-like glutaredoxin family protein